MREFDGGDTLMSEGDFGHSLFLLEPGSADVLVHGVKVREVDPGEVIGEVADSRRHRRARRLLGLGRLT
ncbi:MAG TPA: hypothetical protein VFN72_00815 [Solirubrobacterales bacterium]|nr:hypothetical protein [Solirubrobacterales bacterium]